MASMSTHAAQTHDRIMRASHTMDYFHELPKDAGLAHEYFDHWDGLRSLRLGTLGTRQTALIMQRTGQAYKVHDGSATFGHGFRRQMQTTRGRWLAHAQYSLPHSEIKEIQFIMQGHGALGIQPDTSYYNKLAARAATIINGADEVDLTNILWAHAVLAINPPEKLRNALFKQTRKKLAYFTDISTPVFLWSLAALDSMFPNPAYKPMAETMLKLLDGAGPIPSTPFNIDHLSQIRDACIWFDLPNKHGTPLHRPDTPSQAEREMATILKNAGIQLLCTQFRHCAALDKLSDLAVDENSEVIHLEMDGPWHFIRDANNNHVLDGRTRFQTALMLKCTGEPIARIPFTAFESAQARPEALDPAKLKTLFADMAVGRINGQVTGARMMVLGFTNGGLCLQHLAS